MSSPQKPPKLLDRVRETLRTNRYSLRTEKVYVEWIKRFIRFHGVRHPQEMGAEEVKAFLSHFGNSNERRCLHLEPSFFRSPLLQEWLSRPDLKRVVWVHDATFPQPLNKELSAKERYLDLLPGNKRGTPASSLEGSIRQPHESKEKRDENGGVSFAARTR
jgi:Phage integrase, N-terminal SAM-like domain